MEKLQLLFTKDGIQYQIVRNKFVSQENSFFVSEESSESFLTDRLSEILALKKFTYKYHMVTLVNTHDGRIVKEADYSIVL